MSSKIEVFTFNPFQENTYLIYDDSLEAIIIDPGCSNTAEQAHLTAKVRELGLKPVRLILTHAHIDHVLGNAYIYETYGLKPEMHVGEMPVLEMQPMIAGQYGVPLKPGPIPDNFLSAGEQLSFGNTTFDIRYTPGHSPASLSFYNADERYAIVGDVLFMGSIGRTDLPGGDYDTLIQSIKTELMTLDDDVVVYNGHGPATTIGHERKNNPFLN
ncbi:UNVERIFIED_CONTAM: hypothetical protein GTU68_060901 [Idotea baltica]|nr:hypothetical protein [Idotea baltica]